MAEWLRVYLMCVFVSRYSDSRRTGGHMVNPWDAGMGPREVGGGGGYGAHASAFGAAGMGMGSSGGGGSGGGTSHLLGSLNQLSQMGNDKSKLALNILSAVLQSVSYFIYFLVPLMFFFFPSPFISRTAPCPFAARFICNV